MDHFCKPVIAPCVECGSLCFDEMGGFGLDFCLMCGTAKRAEMLASTAWTDQERIPGHQSYTRVKRFKKYLCRAMRQQSSCSVPRDTWDYLLSKRPYRDAKHIQWTLKQARHLKRKCYDSLPFLTAALCPHVTVPTMTQSEKTTALHMFKVIDMAVRHGPFVSYLFCLEYILKRMGRADMCPHINQIQCPNRREAYKLRLDSIFQKDEPASITSLLRTHG
jgi:hypothetical protein